MRLRFAVAFAVVFAVATSLTACEYQVKDITGNASILSESCNWTDVKNAVDWRHAPTVSDGKLSLWGAIDDPRASTAQWGYAPAGVSYSSPFHIYGNCQSRAIVTILPALPGGRHWNLDPTDTVADVWVTDGKSFRIEAQLPASVAEYGKIEIHVTDPNITEASSSIWHSGDRRVRWSVKRLNFQ